MYLLEISNKAVKDLQKLYSSNPKYYSKAKIMLETAPILNNNVASLLIENFH